MNILQNPFEVLGVQMTATKDEIRAAYRALARRWHPDRFLAGPERDWANEKMAEINAAYRDCLNGVRPRTIVAEATELARVEQMIDDGQFTSAREALMRVATRCAEWNYLFGALMMRTAEYEKGILYLSVAAHQSPDVEKYVTALQAARRAASAGKRRILPRFGRR